MITEVELKEIFDKAVHSFLFKEIRRKSLASRIGEVKVFDKGSKLVVEREGESPIEIIPKEHTSKLLIRKEYFLLSDFDMIRVFFDTLATKVARQQTKAIIEEMKTHAGLEVDAKGDFLGGLIEAAKLLRKQRHDPDLILIINSKQQSELVKALQRDPERAELLKKLLSKRG